MSTPLICYVHIEKAGGTTFHSILKQNYHTYMVLKPWFVHTNEQTSVLTENELKTILTMFPFAKGIGGHRLRTYMNYEKAIQRKIYYLTFLREPIARYLSQYYHHKYVRKEKWSFNEFLEDNRFENFMTRRIAGCWDLEKAKELLINDYFFVGLMEEYDLSLLLLKERLEKLLNNNFNIDYKIQRRMEEHNRKLNTDIYKDRITSNNAMDIELYQFAKEKIFKKMVSESNVALNNHLSCRRNEMTSTLLPKSMIMKLFNKGCSALFNKIQNYSFYKYHRNLRHIAPPFSDT